MSDESPIQTTATRIVFESRWTTLREDQIVRPGGHEGSYAVIEKRRAALVIPWDGEHLHLVKQWRYPTAAWSIEFPQGTLNGAPDATKQPDEDEAPEIVARTELKEELGFTAGTLKHLGVLAFAPGISNQFCDAWLATDLEPGENDLELEEQGLVHQLVELLGRHDERVHEALLLEPGENDLELEEQGLVHPLVVTPEEFDELMYEGHITDAATMAAWAMLTRRGSLPL